MLFGEFSTQLIKILKSKRKRMSNFKNNMMNLKKKTQNLRKMEETLSNK